MTLSNQQHEQIHNVLLASFDEDELKQLAAIELDERLEAIAATGTLSHRITCLVAWAQRRGRITDLLAGALRQNPSNLAIQRLRIEAIGWPVCAPTVDKLFISAELAPRTTEETYLSELVALYRVWERKYTPLAGSSTVGESDAEQRAIISPGFIPAGFEKLVEHGFGAEQHVTRVAEHDLRDAVVKQKRTVILGEPGSGKTTTLWRLVYDFAHAAQNDLSAPIPIFVPLGSYTDEIPLLAYAARFAGELGLYLPAYLANGRAILFLDAMNEMPRQSYKLRVEYIRAFLARFRESPVVITCRTADYDEGLKLEKVDIKPLDVLHQREYLHRYLGDESGDNLFWELAGGEPAADVWHEWQRAGGTFEQFWSNRELPDGARHAMSRTQRAQWTLLHGANLPPLLALGTNPFFLVMLAQVYASKNMLQRNRAKLIAAFVDTLLERERKSHTDGWPGTDTLIEVLSKIAYTMQESGEIGTSVAYDWAVAQLQHPERNAHHALELSSNANLLDISDGHVRFVHQLLQEYFVAVAWRARFEDGEPPDRYWAGGWATRNGWEDAAVLLTGMLPDPAQFLVQLLQVNPALTARCLAESGIEPGKELLETAQRELIGIATSPAKSVAERHAAGNALIFVGDSRPGVGVRNGVPRIEWVYVPAEDPNGCSEFVYQRRRIGRLASFWIAKHPITYAQFQSFVEDQHGYCNPSWWAEPVPLSVSKRHTEPEDARWAIANRPRERVRWYEAVAYTRWLTANLRSNPELLPQAILSSHTDNWCIRLPTEWEWEKAARGWDNRQWPWGQPYALGHANVDETEHGDGAHCLGETSAVGIYPQGASPFGVLDMSGNVWEWCLNEFRTPANFQESGAESRVVRGGSWRARPSLATVSHRLKKEPDDISRVIGFRVVLSELPLDFHMCAS